MASASCVKPGDSGCGSSVSVIIPVYGSGPALKECLENLQKTEGISFEVLLIDDGSPEPVRDEVLGLDLQSYRYEENRGPSYALNRGLEKAKGEFIVVLNSDVQVHPQSLNQLVKALEEREEYGFAVTKLLNSAVPTTVDSVGDALLIGGGGYRLGHEMADRGQYDHPHPVLSAAGTASIYRRSLLKELGGFDGDFFGYLEDLDLSLRAQLRGFRCLYVPSAIVYHHGGSTFHLRGKGNIFRLITRNQIWLVVKNYPGSVFLRAVPRILVFQLLWLALLVSRGFLWHYVRGMVEAFLGLPKMFRKRRHIQRERKTTPRQFWQLLQESERDIAEWQQSLQPSQRSLLLRVYFSLFG